MNAVCTKKTTVKAIRRMAEAVAAQKDYLTRLDAAIGDADHGVNLDRGFRAVLEKLDGLKEVDLGTLLKNVGMTLVSTVGGASGPLYGTAFMYAGQSVAGKDRLTAAELGQAFTAALEGMVKRGQAQVGDKTMVDTLSPAADSLRAQATAEADPAILWTSCLEAAHRGMTSTGPMMALKGRASFLGERSIGHLDPGAVSCYHLIRAIAETALEKYRSRGVTDGRPRDRLPQP